MKFLFSTFFIILSFVSSAQKIRFTDHRNHWKTIGNGADCIVFYRYFSYGTDTVIHGNTYNRLVSHSEYSPTNCTDFLFKFPGDYYIREDTITNKVYFLSYNPTFYPDTFERVLYNYNMNIGDTLRYSVGGSSALDSVSSKDLTYISGIKYQILNMQNSAGYGDAHYTIVEGLGCTGSPILPSFL